MSTIIQETAVSPEALLQQVRQLDDLALNEFLSRAHLVQAERHAPHLSEQETKLLEIISSRLPPEVQVRFEFLNQRRRANRMTRKENAEFLILTNQSEQQAADRIRAVADLAALRGVTFGEMWTQLGL